MLEEDVYNIIKSKRKNGESNEFLLLDERYKEIIKNENIYYIGETMRLMKEFYKKYLKTLGTMYSDFFTDEHIDMLHRFWNDKD